MTRKSLLALILVLTITSCYRMPTDEDFCLVPSTNNPDVTREKPSNSLQNMNY